MPRGILRNRGPHCTACRQHSLSFSSVLEFRNSDLATLYLRPNGGPGMP